MSGMSFVFGTRLLTIGWLLTLGSPLIGSARPGLILMTTGLLFIMTATAIVTRRA